MNDHNPSIAECKSVVREANWTENQFELLLAANTLMENCETDPTVCTDDGLACLDHPGVVAEMGARILYLLTRRDGLGWQCAGYNDLPLHVDKQNWLDYLSCRNAGGEPSDTPQPRNGAF